MNPGGLIVKFKERWQTLNQTQKIVAALVAAGVVVCLFIIGRMVLKPAYADLFTGLEPKDAGAVIEELKAMKVPYQLVDQGKTIQVPEEQVYEIRNQLASKGTLSGGGIGFELFDQSKFGQTDFEQQVGYQRALEGELRRTVVQLEGVEQARVHLVLPQKSVFISDQGTPSASVVLKLKPGAKLKPEQIQGICDLFVGSVEGLKPEDVHVIDTEGNVLSDNFKSSDSAFADARVTMDQYNAQREYEKQLEKRIQQMLTQILGQNQAIAMVTADLDFSRRQTTSTVSSNPDNLKISEQNIRESVTDDGGGGAVGTDSNITTTPIIQGIGSSNHTREENTINYQVDTLQETVINAPGSVRRLSASVVVNEAEKPVNVQQVTALVEAAIGYNQERGDQINVTSMAFDDSYQKQIDEEMARLEAAERAKERERLYAYAGAAGVALVVLAVLLWRRRGAQRIIEQDEQVVEEFVPVNAVEIEREQKTRDDKQQQIREISKEKPDEVAEILKVWLRG
jgi:flagellar M-ring protein FliF